MGLNFVSSPAHSLTGTITVPGDKSISHRSIILGSLASGVTDVNGFLEGEDCLATIRAFQAMGVKIDGPDCGKVRIHGVGKFGLQKPAKALNCGNSGTSMRLLSGLLAAQSFDSSLYGDESLHTRPMKRVSEPLTLMCADISDTLGRPPLMITGSRSLKGIDYTMPQASAQVKSCLLLAGLYASGTTAVIEPQPTRDHTEKMLRAFSLPVEKNGARISVKTAAEWSGISIKIPGDISSAAFFMVAASIIPGSDILIRDVGMNATRTGIIRILQLMGARIAICNERLFGEEPVADLRVQYATLQGIDIDPDLVPSAIDEFPVICIAAAMAAGKTRVTGAAELRSKESDRIGAMAEGLQRLGIEAQSYADGLIISGGRLRGGQVNSFHDHRIAMAFAIAGAAAEAPVTIENCTNVATSFPTFIDTANSLCADIQEVANAF